ncbi:hypothetical protein CR513_28318, partial [Mucuna pruriens]
MAPKKGVRMGSRRLEKERAGAEVAYGWEECERRSMELLQELGFPKGVLPLKEVVEVGRVPETGFVWMKQKAPSKHFFEGVKTLVSYETEVTAYVDKFKMRKVSGVKAKQVLAWVPISEMSVDGPQGNNLLFKTPLGIRKSFPVSAFQTVEDKDEE